MFSTKRKKNSRLLAENKNDYIYFDIDGEQNEFNSEDGKLEIVPNPHAREILYVTGPSGSGKSTYASKYVEKFAKIFPKNDIYLFSRKDSDPVFDKIKNLTRLKIDERLIDEPINILEMVDENTLLIFDDVDSLPKKLLDAVMAIIYDLAEVGRSYKIYGIITSHLVNSNNKRFSRIILNEAHFVTFFKNTNERGNRYFLKEYVGYDDNQIDEVLDADNTRAITIHRFYPNYVMTDYKIWSPKKLKKQKGVFSTQNVS